MLTTIAADGYPHSRPMTLQDVEFDGDVWFFISRASVKVPEIRQDDRINISIHEDSKYVSASGRACIVEDRKKAEEMWNPLYKAYFPQGLDDPDLLLLKIPIERAEYWDSPGGTVTRLIGFVEAYVTGDTSKLGEHGNIRPKARR